MTTSFASASSRTESIPSTSLPQASARLVPAGMAPDQIETASARSSAAIAIARR